VACTGGHHDHMICSTEFVQRNLWGLHVLIFVV
jgi:hypothetical protein